MVNVITINGAPKSGKDTFVYYVKKYCDMSEYAHVVNHSTVDTLKNMLRQLGWNGEKNDVSRKLLSDMKSFWTNCNNGPIKEIVDKIFDTMNKYGGEDVIFFIHCREPLEIDKIKSILEPLSIAYPISISTLIVHRMEAEREAFTNESDEHTAEYSYDIEIHNDGTLEQLKEMAVNFCDAILGGNNGQR